MAKPGLARHLAVSGSGIPRLVGRTSALRALVMIGPLSMPGFGPLTLTAQTSCTPSDAYQNGLRPSPGTILAATGPVNAIRPMISTGMEAVPTSILGILSLQSPPTPRAGSNIGR